MDNQERRTDSEPPHSGHHVNRTLGGAHARFLAWGSPSPSAPSLSSGSEGTEGAQPGGGGHDGAVMYIVVKSDGSHGMPLFSNPRSAVRFMIPRQPTRWIATSRADYAVSAPPEGGRHPALGFIRFSPCQF